MPVSRKHKMIRGERDTNVYSCREATNAIVEEPITIFQDCIKNIHDRSLELQLRKSLAIQSPYEINKSACCANLHKSEFCVSLQ